MKRPLCAGTRWPLLALLGSCLLSACAPQPARPVRAQKPRDVSQLYLGEWFSLPAGRCRVSEAHAPLTESAHLPFANARLKPDVRAVDVTLACESALGSPARSRETLPSDLIVLLADAAGHERAPRPLEQDETSNHFVFELPSETDSPLLAARRYDAHTGKPSVAREAAVSKLLLRGAGTELQVILRPRFRDLRFDALLDALAERLSGDGDLSSLATADMEPAVLAALSKIYGEVRERFQPARFELGHAEADGPGKLRVTVSLSRPQKQSDQFEVARFELGLQQSADGAYHIAAFVNREQARSALRCGELREQLEQELLALHTDNQNETCNVVGELLPGPCATLEPTLLTRALAVAMECRGFAELKRTRADGGLPADFQLTMRRGRTGSGLDRSPRYVVALFENAHVVFHGRHWVTSEQRSDGRTHRALLAALHAHIEQLDWFERRGGQFDIEHCIPSEDLGDVITVVSRERQRMVLNRAGCRGPFSEVELTDLRRHVEQVAGVDGWTEPRKASIDRGIQHWAIAE
jgi:hypothetical protein